MNFESDVRSLRWEMGYWVGTLRRWQGEGLKLKKGIPPDLEDGDIIKAEGIPAYESGPLVDTEVRDFFDFDPGLRKVNVIEDYFPATPEKILEESEDRVTVLDCWSRKKVLSRDHSSMPHFVDFPLKDENDFDFLKTKFNPKDKGRYPNTWNDFVQQYRTRDYPLGLGAFPVGFYGLLREFMGVVELLIALKDRPSFIVEMVNFFLNYFLELYDEILDSVKIDFVRFHEDIAYKGAPIVGPDDFRTFFFPAYREICGFLRDRGVRIILVDSDGDFSKLIPLFVEAGVTAFSPFEPDSGIEVVEVREKYPRLQIFGGINKYSLAKGKMAIDDELERIFPAMLTHGGYIPHLDHMVQPNVSFDDFRYYREKLDRYIGRRNHEG